MPNTNPFCPLQVTGCQPSTIAPRIGTDWPSRKTVMTGAPSLASLRQFTPAPPVPVTVPVDVPAVGVAVVAGVWVELGVVVRAGVIDGACVGDAAGVGVGFVRR